MILESLGKGSFSEVFKGKLIGTGKMVAIKQVQLESAKTEKQMKSFLTGLRKEKAIIELLPHPYIVKVYKLIEEKLNVKLKTKCLDILDYGTMWRCNPIKIP